MKQAPSFDAKGTVGRLFTEAWIETSIAEEEPSRVRVASSRRRGLKPKHVEKRGDAYLSPLHGGVD